MSTNPKIVTYEPDNSIKKGFLNIYIEIFREINSNRWLTYQLFRRNFFSMYKQSFMGILWVVILPVTNVCVFAVLNNSGVFNIGEIESPYPVYALCGMAFWQLFASGLGSCGNALTSAGDMVTRINFSKKCLVFSPMGRTMVSFFIQLILVGILLIYYKILPSIGVLFVPLMILPIAMLTLGIGLIVAAANAIVRDIGSILPMGITLLMYLTPVLYAKPQLGILSEATKYNPMYYFVSAGRDMVLLGHIEELHGFILSTIFSIVVLFVAFLIFHTTETRIAERI